MLLIDGYNLIFAHPRAPAAGQAGELERSRHRLLLLLSEFHARRSASVTVVFDGRLDPPPDRPRTYRAHGVDVVFSPKGVLADEVIVDTVRKATNPRVFQVVTSDRAILAAVRKCGAATVSSQEFWERIEERRAKRLEEVEEEPDPKAGGLTRSETDDWLREFGFDAAGNPIEEK